MSCPHCIPSPTPLSLALLLGTGLLMSLGHCLGMCGPIVGAFAAGQAASEPSRFRRFLALGTFQAGRISSYTLIGALMGMAGAATSILGGGAAGADLAGSGTGGVLGRATAVEGWLSLLCGAFIMVAGAALLGVLPVLSWFERGFLGPVARSGFRSLLRSRSPLGRFGLGLANGFLPCGPVAATALSAAAAGSALRGSLSMLAYGLGTVPVLLALGAGVEWLSPKLRTRAFRAGSVLVLLLGAQLALRGLHALGLVGPFALGRVVLW